MAKYNVFENKEDWAKFRLTYFTSSEAHRLLTDVKRDMTEDELKQHKLANPKSKSKTIIDKSILSEGAKSYIRERVAEMLATPPPTYYNSSMEHGNETEPQAVNNYAQKYGYELNSDGFIYTSFGGFVFFYNDEYNAGGTPDLIITIPKRKIGEIKCPDSKTHLLYMMLKSVEDVKRVVFEYYVQLQMNMWLAGAESGVFISFDDRYYNDKHHSKEIEIPYDTELIEDLKIKLKLAKAYKDEILSMLN
jgi:hypothetical protein